MSVILQPPSVLLIGAPGTGKTYSISSLLKAGLEVFVIITEPTGADSLLDAVTKQNLDLNKLHWKQITPSRAGFTELQAMAEKIGYQTYESLTKLPPQGDRRKARFIQLLTTLNNFTDDRTGQAYGAVDTWDASRVLVVDSLSGLSLMAMDLAVGDKPTAHQGEWGIAMNALEKLLNSLSSGLHCMFVLTAHLERETDELTGGTRLMASTLGKKLAPKIPRFFSEVVQAYREGSDFWWSTISPGVDSKVRVLPLSLKIKPDFEPIVTAYNARLKSATATVKGDTAQ